MSRRVLTLESKIYIRVSHPTGALISYVYFDIKSWFLPLVIQGLILAMASGRQWYRGEREYLYVVASSSLTGKRGMFYIKQATY